jgi:hypothetical protein
MFIRTTEKIDQPPRARVLQIALVVRAAFFGTQLMTSVACVSSQSVSFPVCCNEREKPMMQKSAAETGVADCY